MTDRLYELIGTAIEKSILGLIIIAIIALIWFIVIKYGQAIVNGWTRLTEAFYKLPLTIESFEHTIGKFSEILNKVVANSENLNEIKKQNEIIIKKFDKLFDRIEKFFEHKV